MTASYDPNLAADRDHVRFLINDTDTHDALLSDEEISAVIRLETATGEALPYMAAASCLGTLLARWAGVGRGVMEKSVSRLKIKRGFETSAADALRERMRYLRARGSQLMTPKPRTVKHFSTS